MTFSCHHLSLGVYVCARVYVCVCVFCYYIILLYFQYLSVNFFFQLEGLGLSGKSSVGDKLSAQIDKLIWEKDTSFQEKEIQGKENGNLYNSSTTDLSNPRKVTGKFSPSFGKKNASG